MNISFILAKLTNFILNMWKICVNKYENGNAAVPSLAYINMLDCMNKYDIYNNHVYYCYDMSFSPNKE